MKDHIYVEDFFINRFDKTYANVAAKKAKMNEMIPEEPVITTSLEACPASFQAFAISGVYSNVAT